MTARAPHPAVRVRAVLAEAAASAWARPVPSVLVAVLVAAMCVTTAFTVGRTVAAEASVQQRLEAAGARELVVTDVRASGFLTPDTVRLAGSLDVVDRAVGWGEPTDVHNSALGPGGTAVTAWSVSGDLGDATRVVAGRAPRAGEALVTASAQRQLGLAAPAGSVTTADGERSAAVVGTYEPLAPFEDVSGVVIYDPDAPAHTLDVVVRDIRTAPRAQNAVLALLYRTDAADLQITSPVSLAELNEQVMGDLVRYGRGLLLLVLVAGALLVAVVVLADTLVRRDDLGRRRALGASRGVVVALVSARTVLAATAGAAAGLLVTAVARLTVGLAVEPTFAVGVAVLAVLAAACAALAPAVSAAWQDPVRVLRTP